MLQVTEKKFPTFRLAVSNTSDHLGTVNDVIHC